jgi:hypothetical protein
VTRAGAAFLAVDALACLVLGVGSWIAAPSSGGVGLVLMGPPGLLLGWAAWTVWRERERG